MQPLVRQAAAAARLLLHGDEARERRGVDQLGLGRLGQQLLLRQRAHLRLRAALARLALRRGAGGASVACCGGGPARIGRAELMWFHHGLFTTC